MIVAVPETYSAEFHKPIDGDGDPPVEPGVILIGGGPP